MNILLVEDSDEVSCITVEYLHELGHQVVAVAEAEIAIVRLKDETFDAVMTDIRLPGMSGLELARALVKDYPNLPIVIASGYGALNVEFLLGEKQRTVLMLPKPYDLPDLERTLSEAAALRAGKLTSARIGSRGNTAALLPTCR
jgi:CheY-like chemotaxis protein